MNSKIKDGALIGVGFTGVFVGLSAAFSLAMGGLGFGEDPLPTFDQIEVSNQRLVVLDNKISALFQIVNTDEEDCRDNLRVQLTLLDSEGRLLDVCTSDVIISLPGLETATRKLGCSAIEDVAMEAVADYTLQVVRSW